MAKIIANWQHNSNGKLELTASRKGQCAGCQHEKSCALQFQPNKPFLLKATSPTEKAGSAAEVSCPDKLLLNYQAILYMPTLLALLLLAVISALPHTQHLSPIFITAIAFGLLSLSTLLTKLLLARKVRHWRQQISLKHVVPNSKLN
ncbi:SoxR reducing system RseC family protein [Echinimonas agarilytica]|uniref:SoxR reducing system RseC family protein n=1 Tax=Echinimonas agarilytica TaxID=1215918 RepID=A0AA41W875_9GAMM|nr:SoxR reducing system RseC family protein [Echinimonas agarilytica]MCM2680443.1 SoxR reducing system RseC family protein [Echinimonas agarilytica]